MENGALGGNKVLWAPQAPRPHFRQSRPRMPLCIPGMMANASVLCPLVPLSPPSEPVHSQSQWPQLRSHRAERPMSSHHWIPELLQVGDSPR